ncbi:hypothetical protein SAMN05216570_1034 [Dyella sp. OK004]|uniref:hypothetical protein n=1 Tax=Dyella sp. OK004 TaxID=1855292 RepID=UPI0008EDE4C6|nr:hypothetical protein [Dyella sp. OK004]SFR94698.1 hypothetical protein SAMN05216570_1034 [Dyella sp. OK004]
MKKRSTLLMTATALALTSGLAWANSNTANDHRAVDYPSQIGPNGVATPADPKGADMQAEAHQRKAMADRPLAAGALVQEPGYYRAIGSDGKHGRYVVRLSSGETAPSQKQVDQKGRYFSPDHWRWEADASSVTRALVSTPCPKSGQWFAEVPIDVQNYSHFHDVTVTCEKGAMLPNLNIGDPYDEARVRWVWIGPAGHLQRASR